MKYLLLYIFILYAALLFHGMSKGTTVEYQIGGYCKYVNMQFKEGWDGYRQDSSDM